MHKSPIHLCLVYDTVTANMTPALDPGFRPDEVILLHGPAKRVRADALAAVLKPVGIQVSYWPLQDDRDIEHIRDRLLELMIEREHDDIALNASGGTRPMSIAAYEIFSEFKKPVFYVHPDTDHVSWVHRRDWPSFDLADQIKLPAFLSAHGAELRSQGERSGVPARLRGLTEDLVRHAEVLAKPLATLNWLAQQAERDLRSPALSERQQRWQELRALIERFAAEDVCDLQRNCLIFKDEEARFFVNGGWLETHTYALLYGLRKDVPALQDVGRSVEIIRQDERSRGKPVKNELDVAFLANNRFYIVECKTKRFTHHDTDDVADFDTPGADTLYKLDTLKGILDGLRTRAMLVSYHPLSRWDRQRAADLNIQLCSAQQLPQLRSLLQQWITNR
jgi:hypothetical protein